jgi:hypothetical protein
MQITNHIAISGITSGPARRAEFGHAKARLSCSAVRERRRHRQNGLRARAAATTGWVMFMASGYRIASRASLHYNHHTNNWLKVWIDAEGSH